MGPFPDIALKGAFQASDGNGQMYIKHEVVEVVGSQTIIIKECLVLQPGIKTILHQGLSLTRFSGFENRVFPVSGFFKKKKKIEIRDF